MEGLIIMIILAVVSSLFKKNEDKKKPTKQMPPFSNQPAPRQKEVRPKLQESRPKSLEDFANEVFGQLNEKSKPVVQKVETPVPHEMELPKREPDREVREVKERKPIMSERVPSTRTLTERPIVQMIKEQETNAFQVVPTNQRELMQAIVMTEILGPPKAKRN